MDKYFEVISGADREWSADLLRFALSACAVPYAVALELRNRAYDYGLLQVRSATLPVLSIGNLTTGGTGKTPTVAWLVHHLREIGTQPAIVSRGYRSLDGEQNDEKRLLDELCPGVPHLQNPRRIVAAREVAQSTSVDVIVLDDGFQHRQLHRDLDFVLIDALNPWGYQALLPRGLLRERIGGLSRADVIFITRCELASDERIQAIISRIQRVTSAPVLRTAFCPRRFVNAAGETLSLERAADRVGFAFCGIGNPDGFRRTLTTLATGIPEDRCLHFPDHHHYSAADLHRIHRQAEAQQAEILLTTRKDLVKIRRDCIGNLPLWALDIELTFLDAPEFLTGLLRTILPEGSRTVPLHRDDLV